MEKPFPDDTARATVILGGGLAGLSAGCVLNRTGVPVVVVEAEPAVGGLSRTVFQNGFRFDLGGHRFITSNPVVEQFVKDILKGEFLSVTRKSKICMRDKLFDYPLRPFNALFGLGLSTSVRAVSDYGIEKLRRLTDPSSDVSLEDWVVGHFGRTMFNIYFREYSEKVWGTECSRISKEWVSQRIKGLSLWVAIKNAFFRFSGRGVDTLADSFIYPAMGIGQIAENLRASIEENTPVLTGTRVTDIHHENFRVRGITAKNCEKLIHAGGSEFVSSLPFTKLIELLTPSAPPDIREAALQLKYRDLVIVAVMLDRERVTDLTWMYLPERDVPIGRIHEPKNWSASMAPEGKTHIVSEYFCFEGDDIWNSSDEELTSLTVKHLEKLRLIRRREVIDSCIVRVPGAYPIFEVGYTGPYKKVVNYLSRFSNLHICGRGGMFRYYNMDHAIESGLEVAEKILKRQLMEENIPSTAVNTLSLTPVN